MDGLIQHEFTRTEFIEQLVALTKKRDELQARVDELQCEVSNNKSELNAIVVTCQNLQAQETTLKEEIRQLNIYIDTSYKAHEVIFSGFIKRCERLEKERDEKAQWVTELQEKLVIADMHGIETCASCSANLEVVSLEAQLADSTEHRMALDAKIENLTAALLECAAGCDGDALSDATRRTLIETKDSTNDPTL